MYLNNCLREAGGIELNGVPIDLGKVKTPAYFISAKDDHIAPWTATYQSAKLLGGSVKYVLGGSGHIAGVFNPPAKNKYGYWTNQRKPATSDEWFESATYHEGSWWLDWINWLNQKTGGQVAAREVGAGGLSPIEEAPGRYVRERN